MDIEEIEGILKVLKQNDVREFELENNGVKIKLTRGPLPTHTAQAVSGIELQPSFPMQNHTVHVQHNAGQAPTTPAETNAFDPNFEKVESPIVGTFYRRSSPDADPFVVEGQSVKKGDTLCIIEAMKIMNEIDAPVSGKIEKSLLTDGQVVEFGEVLFLINPNA